MVTNGFDDLDRLISVTTPNPNSQSTTYYYTNSGQIWRAVYPDNTSLTNGYYPTGDLKLTCGSRQYPVEYEYDNVGRTTSMKTWQTFSNWRGQRGQTGEKSIPEMDSLGYFGNLQPVCRDNSESSIPGPCIIS